MKIGLESINMQEGIMVEALLDSRVTGLVMSSEFVRKQGFKKIKRPIYIRNMNEMFNKEKPMEHTVKVNIYYQRHRKKTKINVIRDQKQHMILEILWSVCHNFEIDWKTSKVNMIRCLEKYGKWQGLKQGKLKWHKQKEEENKKEDKEKQEEKEKEK